MATSRISHPTQFTIFADLYRLDYPNSTVDYLNSTEVSNSSKSMATLKTSDTSRISDGYDNPVWGLDNGNFVPLHITALSCIALSFTSAMIVIIFSLRHSSKSFFLKSNVDRFVVYMALCDGLFNIVHSADHLQVFLTRDHPRPKALCVFYAFGIGVFISAQMLMVNIVAASAFSLIYLKKNLSFGKNDWKLLTYIFGLPFIVYFVASCLGKLGPTGQFCHFDAVNGTDMYVYYLTLLSFMVLILNIVLYTLTLCRIYNESKTIANTLGDAALSLRVTHRSARNMGLLVGAFTLQWFPLAAYSLCGFLNSVPDPIVFLAVSLNNIGGAINGGVFILMRNQKRYRTNFHQFQSSCTTISSRL